MKELNFQIDEVYGVLSENKDGWRKELTYMRWNNRSPKFDIRSWEPNYEGMTKGITLTKDELMKLRDILNTINFDEIQEPVKEPAKRKRATKKKTAEE